MSDETNCVICANTALRQLSMDAEELLTSGAQSLIQSMMSGACAKAVLPLPRLGVSVVERCARLVEAPCSGCRQGTCQPCAISAELRSAEARIHAERDAELAALEIDTAHVEKILNNVIDHLCQAHAPFGRALLREWHGIDPGSHGWTS